MASFTAELQSPAFKSLLFPNDNNFEMFLNKFYWISKIPVFSFALLIVCLIRIVKMSLEVIFKEISFGETASTSEMNQLILKWRKSYILVHDLVAEINACFGQQIIVFVLMAMLSSINLTYAVIVKIKMNESLFLFDYIFAIVTNIICLSLLAFISEQIPQQVS